MKLTTNDQFDRPEAPRVLVTGDFGHSEFADLIGGLDVPTMLLPWQKLSQLRESPGAVDLVLIAQSHRGAIYQADVDRIRQWWPEIPLLVLLGSWCEGESRSGAPLLGVTRVYWHQWQGQFKQLQQWVNPSTDAALTGVESQQLAVAESKPKHDLQVQVAVSALSHAQFEMVEDAMELLGLQAIWAEKSIWQAEESNSVSAVCLDCESLTENLTNRLIFLRKQFPDQPIFLLMGFPRKHEVQSLKSYWHVSAVISKPIDLTSLASAFEQAGIKVIAPTPIRIPRFDAPLNVTSANTNSSPVS